MGWAQIVRFFSSPEHKVLKMSYCDRYGFSCVLASVAIDYFALFHQCFDYKSFTMIVHR